MESLDDASLKKVLWSARQFAVASRLCFANVATRDPSAAIPGDHQLKLPFETDAPIVPKVVNEAFAVELYLKCLCGIENAGQLRKGHKIKDLFDALSPASRAHIENGLDPALCQKLYAKRGLTWTFRGMLEDGSDAFERWRYHYEGAVLARHWLLGLMVTPCDELIMSRKPEWQLVQRTQGPN